jgi:hypothetical protein
MSFAGVTDVARELESLRLRVAVAVGVVDGHTLSTLQGARLAR